MSENWDIGDEEKPICPTCGDTALRWCTIRNAKENTIQLDVAWCADKKCPPWGKNATIRDLERGAS